MINSINSQSLLSYYSSSTTSSSTSSTGTTTLASLLSDSSDLSGIGVKLSSLLSGSGVWDQSDSSTSDLFDTDSFMLTKMTTSLVAALSREESELLEEVDSIWQQINQRANIIPDDLQEQIEKLEAELADAVEAAGSYLSVEEEEALTELNEQLTALYEEAGLYPTKAEQKELDALQARLDKLYGIDRNEINSLTAALDELMARADEINQDIEDRLAADPELQAQADELEDEIEQLLEALGGAEDETGELAELEIQLAQVYEEAGAVATYAELAELEEIIAEAQSLQDDLDEALEGDGGVMRVLKEYTASIQNNSSYLQGLASLWSGVSSSQDYTGGLTGQQLLENLIDDLETLMTVNPGSVHEL